MIRGRIKEEGVLVYSIQAHFTPIIVYKHPCMGTVEPDLVAMLIGIGNCHFCTVAATIRLIRYVSNKLNSCYHQIRQ